jgi:hypothetical protein
LVCWAERSRRMASRLNVQSDRRLEFGLMLVEE